MSASAAREIHGNTESFRVVAIRHSGLYRDFVFALAQLIKERHGSEIHLYCAYPEMVATLKRDAPQGVFSSIKAIEFAHESYFDSDLDEDELLPRARRLEERYQRSMNWFSVLDRHFGRGFAPSGFNFPRSIQSETTDHLQVVDTYCSYFDSWEREFSEKGITLMINVDWREGAVARANGVPMRTPTSSRHLNFHYWATDEFGYSNDIAEAYENASSDGIDYDFSSGPYVQMMLGKTMRQYDSFLHFVSAVALKLKTHAYYKYRKHSKGQLYYLSSELRFLTNRWIDARKIARGPATSLKELEGKDFVFFPLQVDPELGFQGRSPEFFFLHTAIVLIARDLPAGVTLAVKEHFPALGYRPKQFYDQIRELKNVVMLDIAESGVEVVRRCRAVATINGSAGQEAAVLGKPVVSFGRHNLYNVLPHVHTVTDMAQVSDFLRRSLSHEFDGEVAAREGRRFVEALTAISFDLQDFSHSDRSGFSETSIELAYDRLCTSLSSTADRRTMVS